MPPNPFMFQKNLPKPGTLPAWRNASSGTLTTLKDILNTCQQGQEDMASRLGVEDKSAEDDVDQLAANIRAEDSTIATLDKESQRLDETLKSQAERLATTQHDNADYDKDRALEMSPSAKDLLKFYLRLFNDFKFLRGLSHEHKVELFSCENELAQHRIAKLEAEVATLKEHAVDTDASAHIDKAVHDEVQAALNEALGKNQELKNELDKVVKQGEEKARDAKMALKAEQNASSAAKDAAKAAEASRKMHEVSNRQLVARRDSLQREVDALKVESSNRDAANQVLTQRLDALANQHSSQLGHVRDEADEIVAELQTSNEKLQQEVVEMKDQIDELTKQVSELDEKSLQGESTCTSLRAQVDSLTTNLAQSNKACRDREKEKAAAEIMAKTLSQSLTRVGLERGAARQQAAELQRKISAISGEKLTAESKAKAAENTANLHSETLKRIRAERAELKVDLAAVDKELDKSEGEKAALEQEKSTLENQAKIDRATLTRVRSERASAQQEVAELKRQKAEAENSAKTDRETLKGLQREKEAVEQEKTTAANAAKVDRDTLIREQADAKAEHEAIVAQLKQDHEESSDVARRDAENEKTRLEADLQEKGEQMEQLSREHAQEAEKLRSEILSLREKAKETAANTESAMNGVQAMADEYRQEVSSLNDELMLCEGRHREQDAEQQQRILDLEGEVIVAQSIQGDKSREIAQVRHDMSELQTQVEAASAVAKADKIRIDDLVKELDSMTLAKQTAERSVADGKSTLAARATTISELEQKIAGQEEHLHKFHLNLAYYLASETWPPMPESSRDVWDALVTSIGQSERKAPLATRETPAKNMPGSWIMAQPWLVDSEHQEYGAGNGVGMMHLLAQLYGRVTLGIVDGATFRLLELLTRESRLPDQGIFDQAIRLLFAKVLEKMPPSASSDTELLCLGFLQLALLVQDRWDMTISEVDEMYTACTQCPTYGELCQLMCKRHGPSVRKFVEDKGILHGDLGLVSFQDIVLVIRFDDCVVRMVDQRRACFADDSHGMFKAPEGHDNIVVEILSGPELGWWFDMKSS